MPAGIPIISCICSGYRTFRAIALELSSFLPPEGASLPSLLHPLPKEDCRRLFLINALMEHAERKSCAECLCIMEAWLKEASGFEAGPEQWLRERLGRTTLPRRQVERALQQAAEWVRRGIWAAAWFHGDEGNAELPAPPQLVFGLGEISSLPPWVGIFNSRKRRDLSPHEDWLMALRAFLPSIAASGAGIASSVGTITYDLASAYACKEGIPLLMVLPFPLELHDTARDLPFDGPHPGANITLSCTTRAMRSPKSWGMFWRDRLLAAVSDVHVVLGVRPGGNMVRALRNQQKQAPREQWILSGKGEGEEHRGNTLLVGSFPGFARTFHLRGASTPPGIPEERAQEIPSVEWNDYLFHYTRSCPGPWPGETRAAHLLSLLRRDPECRHSALDTLTRIMKEGRIRASDKLVRGNHPVVSWTSIPPLELDSIRRWNPALIRWTMEPYGVAVRKRALKLLGGRPAIYGASSVYGVLKPSDRFRFQLHRPPGCSWKHEKEWRSPGDILLEHLSLEDVLIIVFSEADAARILQVSSRPYPTMVLRSALLGCQKSAPVLQSPIN